MSARQIKVLLIEDNPGDARLVREALGAAEASQFEVEWADRLSEGVARLRNAASDVVLLDLSLPDSHGLDTIVRLNDEVPLVPVIALSGNNDPVLLQDAVRKGAEDYLVKGAFTSELLERSIHYAIDRRRARESLAQARDAALESARLRSEFLANMSHEIRTPLNGVIGIARLLTETPLSSDQQDMIEILRASSEALLRIVNDVLDFSKISAGKVALEERDFDLGSAVEGVFTLFSEQARAKGIELASYIDGDVPTMLRGDSVRLVQVLSNLVSNALKFTNQGHVSARIGLVSELGEEVVLRFTVRDTGIGIPLESQRYLFQAFSQSDGSITRKYGGTGLGLAISAQLAELMGGNIGVRSASGEGSSFWFTATFGKQSAAASAQGRSAARFEGCRILLADHSPLTAEMVREQARTWGGRCQAALSAEEALAALKQAAAAGTPYDIALVDLQLPDMDGLTLGRTIKNDLALSHTRVLAMYSLGARPDEPQMRSAGIRGLLVKPVKQSQLFNILSASLAGVAQEAASAADGGGGGRRKNLSEIASQLPAAVRQRVRLLLVEDNTINQQVLLRLLERLGYKAEPVNNGREAFERLSRQSYDIVLLDCQMPELDGYSASRELRRREGTARHTTIIGVTAHALAGDREECLAAGMDDYIAKPIMAEELAAILEKWVTALNLPAAAQPATGHVEAPPAAEPAILDHAVLAQLREFQHPGEVDFVGDLIGTFLADLARRMELIRAGLERDDSELIRENAHTLRGASAELGARRLSAACARLELAARSGAHDQTRRSAHELVREATLLRAALENARARSPA